MTGGCGATTRYGNQLVELRPLVVGIVQPHEGSQRSFVDRWPADCVGHAQDVLPDLGREPQQAHYLGHPRPSDPLSPGDLSLGAHHAGIKLTLPLHGHPE